MNTDSPGILSRVAVFQILLASLLIVAGLAALSRLPVRQTESPPFASPVFQRTWVSDAAAATRVVDLWGGEPLAWRVEPYAGAPNNRRVVQYFERGRMEVESGSSQVTSGNLVAEMVRGEVDLGSGITREHEVPDLPIDSGEPDRRIPTYLTLSQMVDPQGTVSGSEGSRVTDWIDRSGRIDRASTPVLVRRAEYIDDTQVYLPDVFAELFARPEFQDERWVDLFGLPISDPYWTEFRRYGELKPSLVQVFERRILVYTPDAEEATQFTVANSGRHYAFWRYGEDILQTNGAEIALDVVEDHDLTLADDVSAVVYAEGIGTPLDMTLSATGHLMVLTAEGRILIARSQDPDGMPVRFDVWADGIDEPQGMVTRGDSVLVTASNRIWWYHDDDGLGVLDEVEALQADRSGSRQSLFVRGKPVVNSRGDVFTRVEDDEEGLLLRALASDDPLVSLNDVVESPGPVHFVNGDLLIAGRNADDVPTVMMLPSILSLLESDETIDPARVASFSPDASVRAMVVIDEEIWPLHSFGDVFIAIQDDQDGRIFAMSRRPAADETETVELVRGLSRPTALEVGLDGSLYIAEADTGRIIRVQYHD